MVQVFLVLQCYKCNTFQGQQKKKTPKWTCRLCGEKQSTRKIFGSGTGKECRLRVQQLNLTRGEVEQAIPPDDEDHQPHSYSQYDDRVAHSEASYCQPSAQAIAMDDRCGNGIPQPVKSSKWDAFLPEEDEEDDGHREHEAEFTTDATSFQTTLKQQRRKKRAEAKRHAAHHGAQRPMIKAKRISHVPTSSAVARATTMHSHILEHQQQQSPSNGLSCLSTPRSHSDHYEPASGQEELLQESTSTRRTASKQHQTYQQKTPQPVRQHSQQAKAYAHETQQQNWQVQPSTQSSVTKGVEAYKPAPPTMLRQSHASGRSKPGAAAQNVPSSSTSPQTPTTRSSASKWSLFAIPSSSEDTLHDEGDDESIGFR
eukprot:m.281524 g.281524  ORF g.281524 m.281524 type:complete len:370 (-) comp15752_c1_seq1:2100-3209(-)